MNITSYGIVKLSESPNVANIKAINLSNNPIDDAGLIAISNSKNFRSLRKLILGKNDSYSAVGLDSITNSVTLPLFFEFDRFYKNNYNQFDS